MKWRIAGVLMLVTIPFVAGAVAQSMSGDSDATAAPDKLLQVPAVDYRKEWVQLGSFSVLADDPAQGVAEMHVVYTDLTNVEAFLKNGVFPDGAVLIKDVLAVKTESLTTGTVGYGDQLKGRFVMVKDGSNKNAGSSPRWGDGWGWAFYEGAETVTTVTTDYTQDCLSCHEPARDQDFLYLQGYPVLKK